MLSVSPIVGATDVPASCVVLVGSIGCAVAAGVADVVVVGY